LKKNSRLQTMAIVVYSGAEEVELKAVVARCGADGYIKKTNDDESLRRQVAKWLK
jgi:hypothetical protein